ncbi:hypothetical protein LSM04_001556 [Trypanosoma melophagium]|uniref:uncharacterized protein n=1 Tax=Trypanosoma melophagium TaxID=715481 RepID=UPI00351AB0AE|nr:hypothetical protein LSM04_001556 [Trypanosoma melophagium]
MLKRKSQVFVQYCDRHHLWLYPDVGWIDVPSGAGSVLRRIVTNYDDFPEGRYRVVDYLRTAVEMFITQLRHEYAHQRQQAQKAGRTMARFTWRNKGELAICFAASCDMLKLLYDQLRPGPDRPSWEGVVSQFILFLITESRVPPTILTEQTYNTKFLDWRKGGTRYQGEQLASNVRFPSAEERRVKIETYLRSGAGYSIESTVLEAPVGVQSVREGSAVFNTNNVSTVTTAATITATTTRTTITTTTTTSTSNITAPAAIGNGNSNSSSPIAPLVGFPRGQAPVKVPTKLSMKGPPVLVAGKQAVDEYRHLQWLAKLTQITGGSPTLEFPEERSHMILAFVRFCETSEIPDHFIIIMNILIKSGEKIQDLFERSGGMVVLRRFVGTLVRLKDANGLMNLIDRILRMKLTAWGHSSQQSWLRDLLGNSGGDLKWMRTLDVIPAEKQNTWETLVSTLEERYVLALSREAGAQQQQQQQQEQLQRQEHRGLKRGRMGAMEEALRASLGDSVGGGTPALCVSTALCAALPCELRAPPLSSGIEHDTISYLNKKRQLCEEAQVSWRVAILTALNGRCVGMPIPLWYDPYELLGVDPHTGS